MFYLKYFILILLSVAFGEFCGSMASSLPSAVALGGAIVAAVEEEEGEARKDMQLEMLHENATAFIDVPEMLLNERMDEGRGKKYKKFKKHKLMKHLYPLLIGAVLAKAVIIPLVLKALTALSTSSFIMAKIALAASGIIVLKWLFGDAGNERTRFEIVSLPTKNSISHGNNDWNDLSWSGSNYIDVKTSPKQRLKYIPLGGSSSANTFLLNKGIDESDYRYGYDNTMEGKPFL